MRQVGIKTNLLMMSGVKPLFKTKNKKYIMNDLERERGPLVDPMPEPTTEQASEYRPSNTSALKDFPLQIEFLDRGCIVSVGCKRIAFESVHNAMVAVNAYVTNPWDEQQKWRKILD